MKVQYNDSDDNLYCVGCKEKINLGEKYVIVRELIYGDEIVEKEYHLDEVCLPEMEE